MIKFDYDPILGLRSWRFFRPRGVKSKYMRKHMIEHKKKHKILDLVSSLIKNRKSIKHFKQKKDDGI